MTEADQLAAAAKSTLDYLTALYNSLAIDGQIGGAIIAELHSALFAYEAARGDVVVKRKRELVLSSDHRAILHLLAHRNAAIDAHPCTQEIAQALGRSSAAWAHPLLASLNRWGLAQKMGVSFNKGRCWAITDAGRAMIAASQGER